MTRRRLALALAPGLAEGSSYLLETPLLALAIALVGAVSLPLVVLIVVNLAAFFVAALLAHAALVLGRRQPVLLLLLLLHAMAAVACAAPHRGHST